MKGKPVQPNSRRAVISIAKRLFIKKGYTNTSMEEIAQAAGIQKASLYYFFKNKEEIFIDIIFEGFDHLCSFFSKVSARMTLDEFIKEYFRYSLRNRIVGRLIDSRAITDRMKAKIMSRSHDVQKEVERILKDKQIKNSALAAHMLSDTIFAHVLHASLDRRESPKSAEYSTYLAKIISSVL